MKTKKDNGVSPALLIVLALGIALTVYTLALPIVVGYAHFVHDYPALAILAFGGGIAWWRSRK